MFEIDDLIERYSVTDRAQPHLRVNFISSLDGAATVDGRSGGLGDPWDKQVFDVLRRLADVVIVGAGTIDDEGYGALRLDEESVAWRVARGMTEHPRLAVVTAGRRLGPGSPVFAQAPVRPLVLTAEAAPAQERRALADVAEVVTCGVAAVDGRLLRRALTDRGLTQMHCEGGPTLFGTLIEADAVDELCLTLAPMLVGGDARRIAASRQQHERRLRLVHALPGGQMLFLRYAR